MITFMKNTDIEKCGAAQYSSPRTEAIELMAENRILEGSNGLQDVITNNLIDEGV